MKKITKQQVEELIDFLGHPIHLMNVLDKRRDYYMNLEEVDSFDKEEEREIVLNLIGKWGECGLTRSLQEIIKSSGWAYLCSHNGRLVNDIHTCSDGATHYEVVKDPKAEELFRFLIDIFLKNNNAKLYNRRH